MKKINYKKAIDLINKGKQFAIFIHTSPDGDCVGSAKAIECLLLSLGKTCYIMSEDKPSLSTEFICSCFCDDEKILDTVDTFICLDMSGLKRTGKFAEIIKNTTKPMLVIDHHLPQDDFGTVICRDENASSTAELVYNFFVETKNNITPDCATYLYAGISSDTGCFVHDNTNASTFIAAAELKKLGADTKKANYELFTKRPLNYINIAKLAYSKLKIYDDKLSLVEINYHTYKKFQELEAFYVIDALRFYPTDVLIIVTQKDKETVKINARSRNYNVQELCAKFGGGGHIKASGATLNGKLKDVVKKIKEEILKK